MADCRFCKLPAGWFKSEHAQCLFQAAEEERREAELRALAEHQAAEERERREIAAGAAAEVVNSHFLDVVQGRANVDVVEMIVTALVDAGALDAAHMRKVQIAAWEAAARECMKDGQLSSDEDRGLAILQARFALTEAEINTSGLLIDVAKCKVFTALASGLPPHVLVLAADHPVVLKRGEHPVWQFNPTTLLEDQRAGRYQVDIGLLMLTTKSLYFVGRIKSFQLPFGKISSVVQFSDGVGVGRQAVTAKPMIFQTGDGAFAHKLLTTLVRMGNK